MQMRGVYFDVIFLLVDRQVKKEAAMTEKAWKGCGQKVGIKIWRIVKFKASINALLSLSRQASL